MLLACISSQIVPDETAQHASAMYKYYFKRFVQRIIQLWMTFIAGETQCSAAMKRVLGMLNVWILPLVSGGRGAIET